MSGSGSLLRGTTAACSSGRSGSLARSLGATFRSLAQPRARPVARQHSSGRFIPSASAVDAAFLDAHRPSGLALDLQLCEVSGRSLRVVKPASEEAVLDLYISLDYLGADPYWATVWPSSLARPRLYTRHHSVTVHALQPSFPAQPAEILTVSASFSVPTDNGCRCGCEQNTGAGRVHLRQPEVRRREARRRPRLRPRRRRHRRRARRCALKRGGLFAHRQRRAALCRC